MKMVISDQILFHHRRNPHSGEFPWCVSVQTLRIYYKSDSCYRVEETTESQELNIYVSYGDHFYVFSGGHEFSDPNGNLMAQSPHYLPPYVRAASNPDLLRAGYSLESTKVSFHNNSEMEIHQYVVNVNQAEAADMTSPRLRIGRSNEGDVIFWVEEIGEGAVTIGNQNSRVELDVDDEPDWLSRSRLVSLTIRT